MHSLGPGGLFLAALDATLSFTEPDQHINRQRNMASRITSKVRSTR
jgi:hypothetical protein